MDDWESFFKNRKEATRKAIEEWWFDETGKTRAEDAAKKHGIAVTSLHSLSYKLHQLGFTPLNPRSKHNPRHISPKVLPIELDESAILKKYIMKNLDKIPLSKLRQLNYIIKEYLIYEE